MKSVSMPLTVIKGSMQLQISSTILTWESYEESAERQSQAAMRRAFWSEALTLQRHLKGHWTSIASLTSIFLYLILQRSLNQTNHQNFQLILTICFDFMRYFGIL